MRIYVGNRELDLTGREKIQIKYQSAPVGKLLAPAAPFSIEFEIPETAYNLETFGYNDNITQTDTSIFSRYECRADRNGVDLNIVSCEVTGFRPLTIRLYGNGVTFFSQLKDNLIGDLDLSDMDHVWNDTNIMLNLLLADYSYPIINYGVLTEDSNDIPCEYCYPALEVKGLIDRIIDEAGYTLDNEVQSDPEYTALILPFSNTRPKSISDEEKELIGFSVYSSGQTITLLTETEMTFANEVTDLGGNFATNRWTCPYDGYYSFYFKCSARSAVALTTTSVTFALYKDDGTPTLLNTSVHSLTATYSDVVATNFLLQHEIHAGDEVYITATPASQDINIQGGLDASGDGYTRWNLDKAWDTMILGFTWRFSINAPPISQSKLFEYVVRSFAMVVSVNEVTKVVKLTKFETIVNNIGNGVDWTNKIDLSVKPRRTFDISAGAINWLRYEDDDNVVKPTGTDYSFNITANRFSGEQEIYKAPFAASESFPKFAQSIPVVDIEISGESEPMPRILLSDTRRYSTPLNFTVNGSTVDTDGILNVPYFYTVYNSYDLTWRKLASNNLAEYISMISNPRGLELQMRLNESDINQLDFTKPVWLGSTGGEVFNAWFYISEINYDETKSIVKLNLL